MSSNTDKVLDYLKETQAYLEGHFVLSSGLHSNHYVQCALLLEHPKIATDVANMIAEHYRDKNITCVIGPALGGVIIAYKVAEALGVRSVFGERKNGEMCLRRGFSLSPDDNLLVVEDVITTGKSVKELLTVIDEYGSNVVSVASIVDRSNGSVDFGCKFFSLLKLDIQTFQPDDLPEWLKSIPAIKPGSRKS